MSPKPPPGLSRIPKPPQGVPQADARLWRVSLGRAPLAPGNAHPRGNPKEQVHCSWVRWWSIQVLRPFPHAWRTVPCTSWWSKRGDHLYPQSAAPFRVGCGVAPRSALCIPRVTAVCCGACGVVPQVRWQWPGERRVLPRQRYAFLGERCTNAWGRMLGRRRETRVPVGFVQYPVGFAVLRWEQHRMLWEPWWAN